MTLNHQFYTLEGHGQVGIADLEERRSRFWRAEGGQRHHLWTGRTVPVGIRAGQAGVKGAEQGSGAPIQRTFQSGEEQAGSGLPMVSNRRSLQLSESPAHPGCFSFSWDWRT